MRRIFLVTLVNLIILTNTQIPSYANSINPLETSSSYINKEVISLNSSKLKLLNGTWEGTYICEQGLTKMKLIIKAQSTTNIDAIFVFSAHASNPTVPSGSFTMKGTYANLDSVDVPDTLELKAINWISRPSGYMAIDLQGNISPSEKRIIGNVLNAPSCSNFDVVKVSVETK
jgi:hypothetical protein